MDHDERYFDAGGRRWRRSDPNIPQTLRAQLVKELVAPDSVSTYLEAKFGDGLGDTRMAMTELARAYAPKALSECAYDLYVEFRPNVPTGKKGWGAKGRLSLRKIANMAARARKSA